MPTVTVPAEFFRSELRIYSDWREAVARELLQNAVDAGARQITVSVGETDANTRVVFHDDGCGMDRRTLEEVFFALGRSTKEGTGTVGGFGRARVITCFAQNRYRIRTGELQVTGSGGDYSIEDGHDLVVGCRFEIDLVDSTVEDARRAFRRVFQRSTVDTPLLLDGTEVSATTKPARSVRVLRDRDGRAWAKVYLLRDRVGELRVHVAGIPMFSRYLPGFDDILVELDTARSREVLAASRDNLREAYQTQLDHFTSELLRNRRRALRETDTPIEERAIGNGFRLSVPKSSPDGGQEISPVEVTSGAGAGKEPGGDATRISSDEGTTTSGSDLAPNGWDGGDVFLSAPQGGRRLAGVVRTWDPRNWGDGEQAKRRLLEAWQASCSVAVDALLECHPEAGSIAWTVGWLFDDDARAGHRRIDGGHILFLNPEPGRRWKLRQPSDRRQLLARALHEVAHIVVDGHDEDFAAVLTDLFSTVDPRAADRAISDATSPLRGAPRPGCGHA